MKSIIMDRIKKKIPIYKKGKIKPRSFDEAGFLKAIAELSNMSPFAGCEECLKEQAHE